MHAKQPIAGKESDDLIETVPGIVMVFKNDDRLRKPDHLLCPHNDLVLIPLGVDLEDTDHFLLLRGEHVIQSYGWYRNLSRVAADQMGMGTG